MLQFCRSEAWHWLHCTENQDDFSSVGSGEKVLTWLLQLAEATYISWPMAASSMFGGRKVASIPAYITWLFLPLTHSWDYVGSTYIIQRPYCKVRLLAILVICNLNVCLSCKIACPRWWILDVCVCWVGHHSSFSMGIVILLSVPFSFWGMGFRLKTVQVKMISPTTQ